jgi:hypothetical protein
VSKPDDEPCLASEVTPLAGVNQRENLGRIGRLSLVTSVWANQVVAERNGLSWSKKKEQALIVPHRESSELNLEYGVGQLRGLLRLPL